MSSLIFTVAVFRKRACVIVLPLLCSSSLSRLSGPRCCGLDGELQLSDDEPPSATTTCVKANQRPSTVYATGNAARLLTCPLRYDKITDEFIKLVTETLLQLQFMRNSSL